MIGTRQDMHVHSTFSDGRDTIEANVAEAERLGLRELTCVDHVRAATDWVGEYVAAVRAVDNDTPVQLRCAVEAKLLDTAGDLDLPPGLSGIDAIYAADHQVPLSDGPHSPREVKGLIADGVLSGAEVVQAIIASTSAALQRHSPVVIAHLFSVLPKLNLDEREVPLALLEDLAEVAADRDARIEISERWRCPNARTLRPFLRRGVPVLLSTDSHRSDTIGRYSYCTAVRAELTDAGSPVAS
ncbi:MAG TPA: PHP domain-containing protein [Solirubrobacteraceae bacterium]|jgi:putative hydrolase